MRIVRGLVGLPPLARCVVSGPLLVAFVGACYGAVQTVDHYPVGSWFAVTVFVALLGSLVGLVLGLLVGTLWSLASRASHRQPPADPIA